MTAPGGKLASVTATASFPNLSRSSPTFHVREQNPSGCWVFAHRSSLHGISRRYPRRFAANHPVTRRYAAKKFAVEAIVESRVRKAGRSRICLSDNAKILKADCGFGLDHSKSSDALLLICSDAEVGQDRDSGVDRPSTPETSGSREMPKRKNTRLRISRASARTSDPVAPSPRTITFACPDQT